MNDVIVDEVREIRAAIAEQFGFDRSKIIAWAREETEKRKAAKAITQSDEKASSKFVAK